MYHILVVEDDEFIRENMMDILEFSGHQPKGAENGSVALGYLSREHFDLVISDVIMPVMDGLELVRAIRSDSTRKGLPIILVTARADQFTKDQSQEVGVNGYLTKPFDGEDLLKLIDKVLS